MEKTQFVDLPPITTQSNKKKSKMCRSTVEFFVLDPINDELAKIILVSIAILASNFKLFDDALKTSQILMMFAYLSMCVAVACDTLALVSISFPLVYKLLSPSEISHDDAQWSKSASEIR